MSYDTKSQKNRPEPLEKGAALSTVFFAVEKEEEETAPVEAQPPSKSNENDAD